jgi:hypothetical protein
MILFNHTAPPRRQAWALRTHWRYPAMLSDPPHANTSITTSLRNRGYRSYLREARFFLAEDHSLTPLAVQEIITRIEIGLALWRLRRFHRQRQKVGSRVKLVRGLCPSQTGDSALLFDSLFRHEVILPQPQIVDAGTGIPVTLVDWAPNSAV